MECKFDPSEQLNREALVGRTLVQDVLENHWERKMKSGFRHKFVEAVADKLETRSQCSGCAYLDEDAWFPPLPRRSSNDRKIDKKFRDKYGPGVQEVVDCFRAVTGPRPQESFRSSFEMLWLGVEIGCATCFILLAGIFWVAPHIIECDPKHISILPSREKGGPLRLKISSKDDKEHVVEFYTVPTFFRDRSPWPIIGTGSHISGIPGSPESIDLMRKWVMRCSRKHKKCPSFPLVARLPTRILKVKYRENDTPEIRLVEPNGKHAPYICLSHRWGAASIIKTNRQNIQQHKAGIAWSSLPKTFQDAVLVTVTLGTDYLWIDSLCIVQDDTADWERESSSMCAIYAHAFVTIAATSAKDSSGGLFPRTTHPKMKIKGYDPRQARKFEIYVRPKLPHFFEEPLLGHVFNTGETGRNQIFPILTRGWVFQERLLSPRIIHFTDRELLFECAEKFLCECSNPVVLPRTNSEAQTADMNSDVPPKIQHRIPLESKDPTALQGRWRRMMEEYASLSFTKSSDLLPALEGLRQQMQPLRGRFLFGIWEDSLIADLCWKPNRVETTYPWKWRAPTWSWASVNTTSLVYSFFPGASLTDLATAVEVSKSKGRITLRGRSASSSLQLNTRGHLELTYPSKHHDRNRGINLSLSINFESIQPYNPSVAGDGGIYYRRPALDRERVHCLELLAEKQIGGHKFFYLVIREAEEPGRRNGGLYERIGLLDCEEDCQFYAWFGRVAEQNRYTII